MISNKQLFFKFLKDNNAYEQYMFNFKIHRVNPNKCTTKEFFINTFYGDFLAHAFNWKDTIQGYNYWGALDSEWWYHCIMMKKAKYGNS